MLTQIKAMSALQAWALAKTALEGTYPDAKFMLHVNAATLVYFESGQFVFEVPSELAAGVLNRRSENLAIRHALEIYLPPTTSVTVEFKFSGKEVPTWSPYS